MSSDFYVSILSGFCVAVLRRQTVNNCSPHHLQFTSWFSFVGRCALQEQKNFKASHNTVAGRIYHRICWIVRQPLDSVLDRLLGYTAGGEESLILGVRLKRFCYEQGRLGAMVPFVM